MRTITQVHYKTVINYWRRLHSYDKPRSYKLPNIYYRTTTIAVLAFKKARVKINIGLKGTKIQYGGGTADCSLSDSHKMLGLHCTGVQVSHHLFVLTSTYFRNVFSG